MIQNDQNNKEKDLTGIENNIKLGSPSSQDTNSNIIKITHTDIESVEGKESQNNSFLKKFKEALDTEIKKMYIFFSGKERELYVQINSHLHIKQSYEGFSLSNLKKEILEIKKISDIAFNVSKYVHLNMTAIKKILKKFDKNFQHIYGKITFPYIQKKLEQKHSDIFYILNLKIIDEVSAILEDLMKELKRLSNRRSIVNERRSSKNSSNSNKIMSNSDFQNQNFSDKLITGKNTNKNATQISQLDLEDIKKSCSELEMNIFSIDELNLNFRNAFKEWTIHLKKNNKAYNNAYSIGAKTSVFGVPSTPDNYDESSSSSSSLYRNNISNTVTMDIFSLRKDSLGSEYIFTPENLNNIYITLIHSFLFMFSYSIVIPTNCIYMSRINYFRYDSGLALGMTPIGTIFSLFLDRKMTDYSYKKPLLFSCFLYIVSAVLYIIASTANSYTMILLSRFLLGIGSFRLLNRTYLTLFVGPRKISKYLMNFQICSLVGLACGPLFSVPLSMIGESGIFKENNLNDIFNECTLPAWLLLILSCILFFIIIVYYTEPLNLGFMSFRDRLISEKRSIFIDRERMSMKDKNMIDNIDNKLNLINESNKFSDTNLVSRHIQHIAIKESKTNSYLYKCFLIFVILLIIVRVRIFSLINYFIKIFF